METKDRNRGREDSRRQGSTRRTGTKGQPAKAGQTRKMTPEEKRKAAQLAQRRRAAAAKKAAEQEAIWAQQNRQAIQGDRNPQTQPLPEEEVHLPAPNQDRHAEREQEVRTEDRPQRRRRPREEAEGKPEAEQPQAAPTKRRITKPKSNAPATIYTQPAPFNLNRLLIQLLSVTAVVLALTLALSIFFKVEVITVSGADTYSEWAIREASGIMEGDSLFTFSRARAGARIQAELPYVDDIRFGIKLPNTVIIDIVELEVVYSVQDVSGNWWLITSAGRVVEQTDKATAASYTQVIGVKIQVPQPNDTVIAEEDPIPDATAATDSQGAPEATEDPLGTIPVVVTNAQRLQVALQILQELEANDIVGEVATVNVESLSEIELWYGTRYQVELGDTSQLDYKITCMQDAILQLSDYEMGVLDVSFIIWKDQVEFAPFDD